MKQILQVWLDTKTKVVVKFKYGQYTYDIYGYINSFDESGVVLTCLNQKRRILPWASVIFIEEA